MIASTMALPRSPAFAAMYRLPLWFHRRGIRGYERILGIDWLVLTTRGRRTGTPRTVMLDVIGHDENHDVWYVQPADGRRANWLQNLLANPEATVEVRNRKFRARATEVTGAEGAGVVLRFIREHPRYARLVIWFLRYVDRVDVPDAELRAQLMNVPVIALRPSADASE
jgi:deazaflavin-dependent oxidoreductase (nitroreductase family)